MINGRAAYTAVWERLNSLTEPTDSNRGSGDAQGLWKHNSLTLYFICSYLYVQAREGAREDK